jgi:hypothetical protein
MAELIETGLDDWQENQKAPAVTRKSVLDYLKANERRSTAAGDHVIADGPHQDGAGAWRPRAWG